MTNLSSVQHYYLHWANCHAATEQVAAESLEAINGQTYPTAEIRRNGKGEAMNLQAMAAYPEVTQTC